MSNKLWIFGDSYAFDHDDERQWFKLVASDLNLKIINNAEPGIGNLQIFERWVECVDEMKKGDQVAIVLTSLERSYFFKELPTLSQHANAHELENISEYNKKYFKEHQEIFVNYHRLLHNPEHIGWLLRCWLFWLDKKAEELETKIMIIPAFDELYEFLKDKFLNLIIVPNSLFSVEKFDKKYEDVFYNRIDPRANHLCFSNHIILAKFLVENIRKEKDFYSLEWNHNIINKKNLLDDQWISAEFCYNKFNYKKIFEKNNFDVIIDKLKKL